MILEEVGQSSHQNALKIQFLESEKQQLSDHIKNLEDSLCINKQALQQMSNLLNAKYPQQQSITKLHNSITLLGKQNDILKKTNINLQTSISSLKCQILINSQIKQQIQQQYQSVIRNYEQKILQLRRTIQDKQLSIQQKQTTKKDLFQLKQAGIFPRHDLVKMQVTVEDSLTLTKKLSIDNNRLNQKIVILNKQLTQKTNHSNRLQMMIKNTTSYVSLKNCLQRVQMKRPLSNQCITKNISKSFLKQSKSKTKIASQQQNQPRIKQIMNQIPDRIVSTLRQLLFREKKNSELLARELSDLTTKYKGLMNTNKLLTQSNINYQIKREQIKSELNYYKQISNDYQQTIKKRKIQSTSYSTEKQINTKNIQNHHLKKEEGKKKMKQNKIFKLTKIQFRNIMNQTSNKITNSIIRHLKYNHQKRSTSCIIDYIYTPSKVSQRITKTQPITARVPLAEESINDPFLLDYSVIKPAEDFGDISACFKKSKTKKQIISSKRTKQNIMIF